MATIKGIKTENLSTQEVQDMQTRQQQWLNTAAERAWNVVRQERAPLLQEADILVNMAFDLNTSLAAAKQYRKDLRNITEDFATPEDVVWPAKPVIGS